MLKFSGRILYARHFRWLWVRCESRAALPEIVGESWYGRPSIAPDAYFGSLLIGSFEGSGFGARDRVSETPETVGWEKALQLQVVNCLFDPGSDCHLHRQW